MELNSDSVETLILGNSHAYYGINPVLLDGVSFNLANVSQGLEEDYLLLNYFSDRYSSLKTVVMTISYSSLFAGKIGKDRLKYYNTYMDLNNGKNPLLYCELGDIGSAMNKLKKIIKNDLIICDSLGFYSDKKSIDDYSDKELKDIAASTVKRHTFSDFSNESINLFYLEKIAQICHSNNTRLILVTTPTHPLYYLNLNQRQLKEKDSLVNKIERKYEVDYYDFLKDERFNTGDFCDVDHLSSRGAYKFSKIMNHVINRHNDVSSKR